METSLLPRKKLPIGIQTFREIREENCYYADKTAFALQLIHEGKHYFLSRPRRFGKSLFLDTLKELFEGNQALFTGLYAEKNWDWSVRYPVIRLSLGARVAKTPEILTAALDKQLGYLEALHHCPATYSDIPNRLADLIEKLSARTGQRVVVLIDEYDKPILDNITEPELALVMRNALRDLYAVLKDSDAYLKFVFITGVSKFSKVSLFSGLNNLNDITIVPLYSAICGYTEHDLDTVFTAELTGLDRQQIRAWYNGYNWTGEAVYNPFDLLLLFQRRQFKSYWFEPGTPTFLVELLANRKWFTPDLMQREVNDAILSTFDVDKIATEALLWQTGYLTFKHTTEAIPGFQIYTLGYPNREVEAALNNALLSAYGTEAQPTLLARSHLYQGLVRRDTEALRQSIHALFASIPNDWYRNTPLSQFEGYYASIFYSQLAALGLNVQGEDVTNRGRIDLSLKLENQVYLFKFKVVDKETEGKALQQLIDRGYAEKFRAPDIRITQIGVEFSREQRNIVGWDVLDDTQDETQNK
jgi:hypothetical protein